MVEASVTSRRLSGDFVLRAAASYCNTPIGTGGSYGYRQLSVQWTKAF